MVRRRIAIGLVVGALALLAASALAASKPPKFGDCISGAVTSGKPGAGGTGNCSLIPSATPDGQASGLHFPLAVAVSPDGKSVYSAQEGDASVAQFARNAKTGKLKYRGCISGSEQLGPNGTGACKLIPSHTATGVGSGLAGLRGIVASPDGKSVYVVASASFPEDDAIATFDRNKKTGKLKYDSCISGNTATGPAGTGACRQIPKASAQAIGSGLQRPRDLVVSADGKSVYGVAATDADVFWLSRSGTGKLTWKGCITGNAVTAKGTGTGACRAMPHPSSGGNDSGIAHPVVRFVSPDTRFDLRTSRRDASVATFKRGKTGSKLTFQRCLSGRRSWGRRARRPAPRFRTRRPTARVRASAGPTGWR